MVPTSNYQREQNMFTIRSYSVAVSTGDFESPILGSIPSKT